MSGTLGLPRQKRGVPRRTVRRRELRVHSLLGTEAVYRVLGRSGELVEVEVLSVPGLVRRRDLRLATPAVRAMASVRSPAELVVPLDATCAQRGGVPGAAGSGRPDPRTPRSRRSHRPATAFRAAWESLPATGLQAYVASALRRLRHRILGSAGGR